jgi:NAD(P)-dependent dehydrogenase (short-subunit alcohol dehydrogenase family)
MFSEFNNKTVLITGGNSGIGKACALAFAKQGANIMIAARRQQVSQAVVEVLQQQGAQADCIQLDNRDSNSVSTMVEQTIQRFGRIDFAINSAGMVGPTKTPISDYSEQDYDLVMQVNTKAVFLAMKYQLQHMRQNKAGVIINISSMAGIKAGRASSIYTASKHAVVGLTRSAAKEFAPLGIRVNALCPALIDTPMIIDRTSYNGKPISEAIPLGRLGKPEEVASCALWLCSDLAAYTTGVALPMDGGSSV